MSITLVTEMVTARLGCTAGTVHSKLVQGFDVSCCKRILGFIIKHDVLQFCIWEFVVFDGDDVYSVCKDDQMYSL